MSVEEIYTVADSYGKGTKEYNEAMLIAARTYPDKVAAVVNAANIEMEKGNLQAVISILENSKVVDEPEAQNLLGVAYAKDKQYEKAKVALQRAIDGGSVEAKRNMEQLAGVIADL